MAPHGACCLTDRCGRQWLSYVRYAAKIRRRCRSPRTTMQSGHSCLTDLTQRSAIALARGHLNGVRICVMLKPRSRRSNVAP